MNVIGKKKYYGRNYKVYSRQDFESNNRKCPKCGGDCDIDTNIPLYLRSPKVSDKGQENQKPDGSARCKKCGFIFIIDLSGLEDINLDLKKEKFNKKEYYVLTTKEWDSIYKKCPICKENCILHQKKIVRIFINVILMKFNANLGKIMFLCS